MSEDEKYVDLDVWQAEIDVLKQAPPTWNYDRLGGDTPEETRRRARQFPTGVRVTASKTERPP